jgi:hypothetical protein
MSYSHYEAVPGNVQKELVEQYQAGQKGEE